MKRFSTSETRVGRHKGSWKLHAHGSCDTYLKLGLYVGKAVIIAHGGSRERCLAEDDGFLALTSCQDSQSLAMVSR